MRSNWWQCLALAWTWWIQGIRHRVPQCLLSSRHRKASYQQHNSQGQRTLQNSYCCCFLGHFRNHKQVSAQMDCSLPASTLMLILIRPRLKMILTLCSLGSEWHLSNSSSAWYETQSLQDIEASFLLGVTVGINCPIRFCSGRLPVLQRQPVECKPFTGWFPSSDAFLTQCQICF